MCYPCVTAGWKQYHIQMLYEVLEAEATLQVTPPVVPSYGQAVWVIGGGRSMFVLPSTRRLTVFRVLVPPYLLTVDTCTRLETLADEPPLICFSFIHAKQPHMTGKSQRGTVASP